MGEETIRFDDGAAYERYMGKWSQLAGEAFLAWLSAPDSQRWLDVGCGNGAFTELILARCAPAAVTGIDPSEEQLAFARARFAGRPAEFRPAGAQALPFAAGAFDAAVMPLVLFFLPEPSEGVAEMRRVVRPGGLVTAYVWDMPGGGFPYATLQSEMRALGLKVPTAPSPDASRLEVLVDLWKGAGLAAVETQVVSAERTFAGFDDWWAAILGGPSVGPSLRAMTPAEDAKLRAAMRARLPADAEGRITCGARAHAVRGRVP